MSKTALYWIDGRWQSLEVDNADNLDGKDSLEFSTVGHKHFKSDITDIPGNATTTQDGFMSANDKTKLDGIAINANKYTHPTTSGNKHIPSGGSDGQVLQWIADGTASWATLKTDSGLKNLKDGSATGSLAGANRDMSKNMGENTFVFGVLSSATSNHSISLGYNNTADGYSCFAGGAYCLAGGSYSHTEGYKTEATGEAGHSEGYTSIASGQYAHAEGYKTEASGKSSHAEGHTSKATEMYAHSQGMGSKATGIYSHAEGCLSTASGRASRAGGNGCSANGDYSIALGCYTYSDTYGLNTIGVYNKKSTGSATDYVATQNAFVIGNGTSNVRANAFRVSYDGKVYGLSAFNSTGADYAEYFEWKDGNPNNEDRIGHFVTLDGDKIKFAESEDDYIIGIISGNQSIIGNACEDSWNDMYLRDEFDRLQYDIVEVKKEEYIFNEETDEIETITKPATEKHIKLNPNYDPKVEYVPRSERKEWGIVGMLGQIKVRDDGTCKVNEYCKPSANGIATHSNNKSHYRVIERINDNTIKVIMR